MCRKVSGIDAKRVLKDGKLSLQLRFVNIDEEYPDGGGNPEHHHIIIYRQEEKNFVFDYDEKEYFDGMLPTEENIIFDGILFSKHSVAEFYDFDVEIGKTYIYWIGKKKFGTAIAGPVPVKVRDADVWWSFERICEEMNKLKSDFPQLEIINCGETVKHRPLNAIVVGNTENIIACTGAVHAGESGPEISIMMLRNILEKDAQLLEHTGLAVLPVANADCRERMANGEPWYIRKNENHVDLNRNFDSGWEEVSLGYGLSSAEEKCATYRGAYPNSEPETKALMNYISRINPRAHFSFHWLSCISTDSLLSSKKAKENVQCEALLNELAFLYSKAFRSSLNLPAENRECRFACTSGSYTTWLHQKGIFAFDLEMGPGLESVFGNAKYDLTTYEELLKCTTAHTAAMKEILKYFAK